MADSNVVQFPPAEGPPEFIVGPFTENRVVLEGKRIPKMTAFHEGDQTFLVLDNRLSVGVPKELAYQVAWFAAHAMAIGAGYASFLADEKFRPFASNMTRLGGMPNERG